MSTTTNANADGLKERPVFVGVDFNTIIKDPNTVSTKNYERRNIVQAGMIPDKYVNRSKSGEIDELETFRDPYPRSYKARLANAYEFDNIIKPSINTLANYILKGDFRVEMIPTTRGSKETPEEIKKALDEILDEEQRDKMLDFCLHVDQICKLKQKVRKALIQKYVFGRSALFIERANDSINQKAELVELGFRKGIPIHLKPLNSYWLGDVHTDPISWEPISIDYDDESWTRDKGGGASPDAQPPIAIEDLIYFTHDDNGVAPNSLNYGLSMLQNIMALSGANRRLSEKVLPELNTSAYAGTGLFKFQGMSAKDIKNFIDSVLPASIKAVNQAVEFQQIKLDYDMMGILEQRDRNAKHMAIEMRMPSPFINFENITNRATTEQVAIVWQQTTLEPARDELRDTLWEQWYKPLIEFYYPDSEFLYMRIKIQTVFESLEFASFADKAAPVKDLYNSGIISLREAREMLGRPPFPEDQEQLQENIKQFVANNPEKFLQPEQQQQMMDEQQEQQEQGEEQQQPGQPGQPPQTNTRLRGRQLLRR